MHAEKWETEPLLPAGSWTGVLSHRGPTDYREGFIDGLKIDRNTQKIFFKKGLGEKVVKPKQLEDFF
ncbi:hypothetical protein EBT23_06950 [bacterium]|nr:hypothetical protein [bacterium]